MKKLPRTLIIKETPGFAEIEKFLHAVEKTGYPCKVEISEYKEGISGPQRRYYFGVVVAICADAYGYSKDEMHVELKRKYLPDYENVLAQMGYENPTAENIADILQKFLSIYQDLTITAENTGSFEAYLKRIREGEAELRIPLPNEGERWDGWEQMK